MLTVGHIQTGLKSEIPQEEISVHTVDARHSFFLTPFGGKYQARTKDANRLLCTVVNV